MVKSLFIVNIALLFSINDALSFLIFSNNSFVVYFLLHKLIKLLFICIFSSLRDIVIFELISISYANSKLSSDTYLNPSFCFHSKFISCLFSMLLLNSNNFFSISLKLSILFSWFSGFKLSSINFSFIGYFHNNIIFTSKII